jgi:5-methylcytosine-specific restriction enzyme B
MINSACPFFAQTFDLLATLHSDPEASVYKDQKEAFQKYLIDPFEDLMLNVAQRLPSGISERMETQKNLFGKIIKNDFGRGGAWDFYWGAFYQKGKRRTESAQLFLWINNERIEFGFFIGDYGKVHRKMFLWNVSKYSNTFASLLHENLSGTDIHFAIRRKVKEGSFDDYQIQSENIILALSSKQNHDFQVAMILPKEKVFNLSKEQIIALIVETYEKVFPFILLAIEDNPLPRIDEYLLNHNPKLCKLISDLNNNDSIQNYQ